jgi:hypothetical protein
MWATISVDIEAPILVSLTLLREGVPIMTLNGKSRKEQT